MIYTEGVKYMSNIGNKQVMARNLAYYLDRSGKTQKEMAAVVGVAPSTFNDWMKAKKYPRIDKIEILANYFGVEKSDLIESKVFDEEKALNDTLASIIVRLRTDETFLSVVENLYELESEKLEAVKPMLTLLK